MKTVKKESKIKKIKRKENEIKKNENIKTIKKR